MKLQFKKTDRMTFYHWPGTDFTDGSVKDVKDGEAKRLLQTFPDNFFEVSEDAKPQPDPEVEENKPKPKKAWRGKKNKAVTKAKNK